MLKKLSHLTAIIFAIHLSACGGGSDSDDQNNQLSSANIEPSATTEKPIIPDFKPVTQTPSTQPSLSTPSVGQVYHIQPNVSNCVQGQLSLEAEQAVLKKLNEIRTLHGLQAIVYDETHAEQMMRTALVMAANRQLSHSPSNSWLCYSAEANIGASTSNLYMISGTNLKEDIAVLENDLVAWLIDEKVESSGHRRWLLDPFLTKVAYGSVSAIVSGQQVRASSLKVIYNDQNSTTAQQDVIAYPMGDYPKAYFKQNAYLSVSILGNTTSRFANQNIDYSQAVIKIKPRGGQAATIQSLSYNNDFMGLPNHLQFKLDQVKENIIYDVHLDNVKVNNVPRRYDYWFQLK